MGLRLSNQTPPGHPDKFLTVGVAESTKIQYTLVELQTYSSFNTVA